jgi:hypothetical protein
MVCYGRMSDLFLDLRDRAQALRFVVETKEYLPPKERERADDLCERVDRGERIETRGIADMARLIGRDTWVARRALAQYVETPAGCAEEWRRVTHAVSASTGHIMERFKHGTTCAALHAVLAHEDSDSAFRDVERIEIREVHRHVLPQLYHEQQKELKTFQVKAEKELKEITKRIKLLRDLAFESPWIQDEILSKIERWEDQLYFRGRPIPTELLDQELAFYREEKAIPSIDP